MLVAFAVFIWVVVNYVAVETCCQLTEGKRFARMAVLAGAFVTGAILPCFIADLAVSRMRGED